MNIRALGKEKRLPHNNSVHPNFSTIYPAVVASHQLFWSAHFILLILIMMSFISRNKRVFTTVVLAAFFFLSGILTISADMVYAGGAFFISAIIALIYLPVFWFLERRVEHYSRDRWIRKEVWLLALLMLLLNSIGFVESLLYDHIITLLFAFNAVVIFLIHYDFEKKNKMMPFLDDWGKSNTIFKRYGMFVLFTLLCLFSYVFYLETGENELVRVRTDKYYIDFLLSFFFLSLLFFMINWVFRLMKHIYNLRSEQKKMELAHLQHQVNPHFFFNMLNNLYGFVEEDAAKAQELILKLSDMMRYSIYTGQQDSISIAEEVDYLKNYIALHRMRYHKDISIVFETDIERETHRVKPLLFILLLENAFKHGVENLREGAFVHMSLKCTETAIHFVVKNNYNKTQVPKIPGIGLKNLKRRLALIYPKQHQLTFEVTDEEYKATLILKTL
ncbi:sensor histidine kinase [Spongiimicrobium salis]|uniref:sensor histidine kinase n=1 Tax=Spongiimicrobium salis TaxID=1667022 RepID=UPI00374D5856